MASEQVPKFVAKCLGVCRTRKDRVACSLSKGVNQETGQIDGIGDEDRGSGDAGLASPVREHDDSIRLVPGDA